MFGLFHERDYIIADFSRRLRRWFIKVRESIRTSFSCLAKLQNIVSDLCIDSVCDAFCNDEYRRRLYAQCRVEGRPKVSVFPVFSKDSGN